MLSTILLTLAMTAAAQAPQSAAAGTLLTIDGDVAHPTKLTAADLAKLPHVSTKAKEHDGSEATYTGVALIEVLKLAGVEFGESLRGKRLATYLVVEATDGYRVVFALPELDPAYTDKQILLVDQRDGKPLAATQGPLRIIVPDEKRQARWARQVIKLSILHVPDSGKAN